MSKNVPQVLQKYSNNDPFWSQIQIENSKIKIKNKIDPNFEPLTDEIIERAFSNFDNKKTEVISLLFPPEITFTNDVINIGEFFIDIKNENLALASFISFLKIPYASFYRNNQFEFNQKIILHFLDPQNFKNKKANLKMTVLVEGRQIIHVYSTEELKYSSFDKISIKKSLEAIKEEGWKPSSVIQSDQKSTHYLFFESNEGYNIGNGSYSTIKIIEYNELLNKSSTITRTKNNVSGNYFNHKDREKLSELLNFDLSQYDADFLISRIVILAALKKYDQSLLKQAILQQVNSTGFQKMSDFLDILSCFSKQYKIEKQIKTTSNLLSFLELLKKNLLEEENQIKETFNI